MFRRRFSKRPVKGKRNYKRKSYPKKGKGLVTKAQLYRAIARTAETKQATAELVYTRFNAGITNNSEMYGILPGLAQGIGADQRIGDQIRPKKLVVRGYINYDCPSNQPAAMIISRMFCFQPKSFRDYLNKGSVPNTLLTNGANPSAFTGALLEITRPQNREQFTFYKDQKHTFLKPWGYTNTTSPTYITDVTAMDKSLCHFFTITLTAKQLPAVLKYNTDGATHPTNFLPLMALGYADAFNASPDTITTKLGMSWSSTLYYEDA